MPRSTYDRFWRDVDRAGGPRACWPWKGAVNRDGRGVFTVRGRRTTARRYAYRMQYGDPGALRVVAGCGVDCVNFRHLRLATAQSIAVSNGSAAARNAAVTQCPRGHELAGDNVYRHPSSGRRECARCKHA